MSVVLEVQQVLKFQANHSKHFHYSFKSINEDDCMSLSLNWDSQCIIRTLNRVNYKFSGGAKTAHTLGSPSTFYPQFLFFKRSSSTKPWLDLDKPMIGTYFLYLLLISWLGIFVDFLKASLAVNRPRRLLTKRYSDKKECQTRLELDIGLNDYFTRGKVPPLVEC